jgi:hypothetical protein
MGERRLWAAAMRWSFEDACGNGVLAAGWRSSWGWRGRGRRWRPVAADNDVGSLREIAFTALATGVGSTGRSRRGDRSGIEGNG